MADSAFKSRLTHYKTHEDYRHFGEALLSAASEGRLAFSQINGISTQEILWQLGIALGMTRDEIIICLSQPITKKHDILPYITDDFDSISAARAQLRSIADSAICYTEQDTPEGYTIDIAETFA
ncbi:hypothetical protein JW752_00775 [Candidatus Peregrinibacteria bacterium]|nr:hypothetical protein [Candidatus Peregrinibacteria bacterium]